MKFILNKVKDLYHWTLKWGEHPRGPLVLSGLTFIEASFFPLPADPLLLALSAAKPKKGLYFAFLTTFWSVTGALFGYWLGVMFWSAFEPFFLSYVFSPEKFELVMSKYQNHVFLTVFIASFTPIPFKIFTIAGGVLAVPLLPFTTAAILGRGARFFIIGGLFFFFGSPIKEFIEKHFDKITIAVTLFLIAAVLLLKGH